MRVSNRDVRVSDAERDAAADLLGEHFRTGRLQLHEYDERVGAAYRARTFGDLKPLFADLPRPPAAVRGNQTLASVESATVHVLDRVRLILLAGVLGLVALVVLAIHAWWLLLAVVVVGLAFRLTRRPARRSLSGRSYARRG